MGVEDRDYEFPQRWTDLRGHSISAARSREFFQEELRRELARTHPLWGVRVTAIARCHHCDDVLFRLPDGHYASVHLTYVERPPDRPPWPLTELYDDWDAVTTYLATHDPANPEDMRKYAMP